MLALYCTINCENDLFTLHKKVTRFYCTLGNEQHILIKNVCFLAVLHTVLMALYAFSEGNVDFLDHTKQLSTVSRIMEPATFEAAPVPSLKSCSRLGNQLSAKICVV